MTFRLPALVLLFGAVYGIQSRIDKSFGQYRAVEEILYVDRGSAMLPNFKNFDIKAQAVAGAPVPLSQIGWATAYGLVYISLLLVVSVWIFRDRNLK